MVRNNTSPGPEQSVEGESPRASSLFVIYQKRPDEALWQQLEGEDRVILSFADEEWEEGFIASCHERRVSFKEFLRAASYVEEASLVAREKYLQFVAEWPGHFRKNGRNFKQLFTYKNEIAYWWLSSASFKDTEVSPIFEYLCHMEVVRRVLKEYDFRSCMLVTHDKRMATLVAGCCAQLDLQFAVSGDLKAPRDVSLLRGLAGRVRSILFLTLNLALGRVVLPRSQQDGKSARVAFLTVYPDCVTLEDGRLQEKNYRDLPERVAERRNTGATLLVMYPGSKPSTLYRLWKLRKHFSQARNPKVVLLNRFLYPSDLGVALSNLLFFARYFWIDRTDRGFRESFVYDGVDVYELVGKEFRRWFLSSQIPNYLVMARAVERAVRSEGIQHLVCFLELYPLARAAYYGAKRGNRDSTTVAYQHANINRMKLWYGYRTEELIPSEATSGPFIDTMPIPDLYIFQGQNGMRILTESGYPADRCILTGSPRYDGLADLVQRPHITPDSRGADHSGSDKTKVLVLPSLSPHDAQELIDTSAQACDGNTEYSILVKPHPDLPVDSYVQGAKGRHGSVDMQVVQGNLHALIQGADVIITSYSTAGDEAIALGRPVICYTGLRPCGATFLDIEAAPLVHSAVELRRSLQSILHDDAYRRKYQARWDDLVKGSFYSLDGRAKERILEALLPETAGPSK